MRRIDPTTRATIDFGKLGGPVYVGRERGELARQSFKLDEADESDATIRVVIPDDVYSINSSYFLGLFGPSIKRLGSSEAFFCKYIFEMPPRFRERVGAYVSRALHEGKALF